MQAQQKEGRWENWRLWTSIVVLRNHRETIASFVLVGDLGYDLNKLYMDNISHTQTHPERYQTPPICSTGCESVPVKTGHQCLKPLTLPSLITCRTGTREDRLSVFPSSEPLCRVSFLLRKTEMSEGQQTCSCHSSRNQSMRGSWMTESWGKSDKAHHRLTKAQKLKRWGQFAKASRGPGLVPEGKTDSGRNSMKTVIGNAHCQLTSEPPIGVTHPIGGSARPFLGRYYWEGKNKPKCVGQYSRNKKGKGESPGSASIPLLCFLAALTWTALLSLLPRMMDGAFGSMGQAHHSFSCFCQAFCSEKRWEMTNTEVRILFLSKTCLETICKDIQTQQRRRNVLVDLKNTVHAEEGGTVKCFLSIFLF